MLTIVNGYKPKVLAGASGPFEILEGMSGNIPHGNGNIIAKTIASKIVSKVLSKDYESRLAIPAMSMSSAY